MARFVKRVEVPSENSFAAADKYFEYITLPEDVAAAICAEAEKWEMVITSEEEVDNDDYGTYYVRTTEESITVTEMSSLSEDMVSYFIPVGDILVEDGKFIGVISYCGKNTNRYGYHTITPITADPYYGIPEPYMRPDPGEVRHDFGIFYLDGKTEGSRRGLYSSWESRCNSYDELIYSLRKKQK